MLCSFVKLAGSGAARKKCREKHEVYLGVKTCRAAFFCFAAIVKVRSIMFTSLFYFFYVTGKCPRILQNTKRSRVFSPQATF